MDALALLFISIATTQPLIAIDAGHGGSQYGAVGACGVLEKDVCLKIAHELLTVLEKSNLVRPYLVRSHDATLSLDARADFANAIGAENGAPVRTMNNNRRISRDSDKKCDHASAQASGSYGTRMGVGETCRSHTDEQQCGGCGKIPPSE
jgi:hypothetical protein